MKNLLVKLHWFSSIQLGVDPRSLLNSFRGLPKFCRDLYIFKKGYVGKLTPLPCLHDWYSEAGPVVLRQSIFQERGLVREVRRSCQAAKPVIPSGWQSRGAGWGEGARSGITGSC